METISCVWSNWALVGGVFQPAKKLADPSDHWGGPCPHRTDIFVILPWKVAWLNSSMMPCWGFLALPVGLLVGFGPVWTEDWCDNQQNTPCWARVHGLCLLPQQHHRQLLHGPASRPKQNSRPQENPHPSEEKNQPG